MSASDEKKADFPPKGGPANVWYRPAVATAVVVGLFALTVAVLLIWNYVTGTAADPLDAAELTVLKAELAANPADESKRQQIRSKDLELRKEFLRRRALAHSGTYMLAAGLVVCLIAAGYAAEAGKKLPRPVPKAEADDGQPRQKKLALRSVVGAGVILAVAALVLPMAAEKPALLPSTGQMQARSVVDATAERITLKPTTAEATTTSGLAGRPRKPIGVWPRFRGPGGLGISAYANVPTDWDGKTKKGILWRTPVPLPGRNSPVVWEDRVFLTGATKKKREVYCFDADSGKALWQRPVVVPGNDAESLEVASETGHAASTAATDGKRVFAIFANGDVACFDFQGKQVWARNLGAPENTYGHASSLAVWQNLLLIQYDQASAEDSKSVLLAMDAATGTVRWQTGRPVGNSWSSPIVVRLEEKWRIVTAANPWVIAYDPADGSELWRAECLGGDVAPSLVYADGLVYAVNTDPQLSAIRTGGSGDVTKSHIIWTAEDGLPDICSPLTNGKRVWLLTTDGLLTCYDAKTGKRLQEKEFDASFLASPALAGDRLYLLSTKGIMYILSADAEHKELNRCNLGEEVSASPAFLDGRIYIRGEKHLYCIGAQDK